MVRIQLSPEESPQTIGSAGDFTRLIPIIQNHAGSIVKFLGDGVIATFGVARPSPTYAADATVALDEALAEIDRWNAHRHAARRLGHRQPHADRDRTGWCRPTNQGLTPKQSRPLAWCTLGQWRGQCPRHAKSRPQSKQWSLGVGEV
jgi:hypothetical protein